MDLSTTDYLAIAVLVGLAIYYIVAGHVQHLWQPGAGALAWLLGRDGSDDKRGDSGPEPTGPPDRPAPDDEPTSDAAKRLSDSIDDGEAEVDEMSVDELEAALDEEGL